MGLLDGFGSILIGGLVAAMLYGIMTLQTHLYYMHYFEDASTIKLLVAAIWILDTLHVSFMCHALYYYLITNYGVLTSTGYIVWSLPASVLARSLVIAVVQFFLAHKIYHLCRPQLKWLVTAPIILLISVHFGFGIGLIVSMFVENEIRIVVQIKTSIVIPFWTLNILSEGLITMSLSLLLYKSSSQSTSPRTKRLLKTLIIYAVNRCLLTLLVAIAELTMIIHHHYAWAMGLDFIIGKLYANSLLASLNTRQHNRSQLSGGTAVIDLRISTIHFPNVPQLLGNVENPKNSGRCFDMHEDITTVPACGESAESKREGEM